MSATLPALSRTQAVWLQKPSQRLRVHRLRASKAQQQLQDAQVVLIPGSREEAIQQASHAIQLQLPQAQPKQKRKRGFQVSTGGQKLAVEIPVAGDGAQEATQLALDVLQKLRPKLGSMTVVLADEDAALLAKQQLKGAAAACLGLREACAGGALSGSLLLVGPETSDVALVEQLLDEVWQGEVAVLLNARWSLSEVPADYKAVVESFEVVFSFLPVSIQGMLGSTQEGAVLRRATSSNIKACPWQILYKQKDDFVQVLAKPARPTSKELELVFYNMNAASSPVAKTVAQASSFIKGLLPGKNAASS